MLFFSSMLKAQVTVVAFPMNPQSGSYNYFGVRVTLAQTYDHNVTVTGYIHDDGAVNTNTPFTLTVTTGNLTAETAVNFYQTDPTATGGITLGTIATVYAGVTITYEADNCILNFGSEADLKAVIEQLDADYDDYNDDYDSQYPNLTEEELDDMDEQNEFDEFKKFRDFENLFGGFCSKRAELENEENIWLANNFSGSDPDDLDLTFDEAENTIFNNNYSFKIGNDVYQLTSLGIYKNGVLQDSGGSNAAIKNDNSDILYASNAYYNSKSNSVPIFSTKNFITSTNKFGYYNWMHLPLITDCKSNKKKKESVVNGNNTRRIDLKIAITSFWVGSSVKAKAVSYKKKNGNWKRKRTKMAVGCGGTVYEGDCNGSFQFTQRTPPTGYKMRKGLKSARRSQFQIPGVETNWKTYTGLLGGTVDAPDANVAGTVVLTF